MNDAAQVHDEEAMRYLSLVIYPLVVGYSAVRASPLVSQPHYKQLRCMRAEGHSRSCIQYSLANDTHKSWYSWILGSVVGCVYSFGFIM